MEILAACITAKITWVLRAGLKTDHNTARPAVEKWCKFSILTADIVITDVITADDVTEIGAVKHSSGRVANPVCNSHRFLWDR